MKSHWTLKAAALLICVALPAHAQGKGKGAEKKAEKEARPVIVRTSNGDVITDKKTAKAIDKAVKEDEKRDRKIEKEARKHVTPGQAVIVTRDVLVANGFQVTNVVPSGATQVIYYRRGNMGKGRGLGPIQKIYVVPAGDVVSFQSVPQPLLATILRRLGM
jgi:hypothetical protein